MLISTENAVDQSLLTALKKIGNSVGRTPIHHVGTLFSKKGVKLFAKKEWMQISGSVKARAAYYIIRAAILQGRLNQSTILLDASSGNTGIAYASICKQLGIRVSICLPENATLERIQLLNELGATIIFTSKYEGTDGAQQVAAALAIENPAIYFYADQYRNEYNWRAHYDGTAVEIYESFPTITHFVAGLGTTGTFIGTGRKLKELNPAIQLVALHPDNPLHGLEGWKHLETAIRPGIYDDNLADQNRLVDTLEAYQMIKEAKKYEGLLLSPSAAANLVGAIQVANEIEEGNIITVLPDNADKYSELIKKIMS